VPSDKARAVVDAMERDMGTTLATKQDLEFQTLATRKDLEVLRMAVKQDIETLRSETKQSIVALRAETKQDLELLKRDMKNGFELVEQQIKSLRGDVSRDITALDQKMTIKFGWMLFLGLGLVVTVLRLWV
jgi:hypothetical protein